MSERPPCVVVNATDTHLAIPRHSIFSGIDIEKQNAYAVLSTSERPPRARLALTYFLHGAYLRPSNGQTGTPFKIT